MLHFTTPHGDHYTVNEKGQIGTQSGYPVKHSSGWTFLGIAKTGPGFASGTQVLTFEDLTPAVVAATQWRYMTSQNPRFTVIDLDRGTRRTWGNTKYHGISSMWYE